MHVRERDRESVMDKYIYLLYFMKSDAALNGVVWGECNAVYIFLNELSLPHQCLFSPVA